MSSSVFPAATPPSRAVERPNAQRCIRDAGDKWKTIHRMPKELQDKRIAMELSQAIQAKSSDPAAAKSKKRRCPGKVTKGSKKRRGTYSKSSEAKHTVSAPVTVVMSMRQVCKVMTDAAERCIAAPPGSLGWAHDDIMNHLVFKTNVSIPPIAAMVHLIPDHPKLYHCGRIIGSLLQHHVKTGDPRLMTQQDLNRGALVMRLKLAGTKTRPGI